MKKEEKKSQILWQLFKATFLLSAFTFGGGFVIVSLMKKKFVEELGWLDESEMLDITAIAQSSPGPIPINASVILGYRMCGIPGSLVAILGTALPPMIIISTISYFYAQFRSNQILPPPFRSCVQVLLPSSSTLSGTWAPMSSAPAAPCTSC